MHIHPTRRSAWLWPAVIPVLLLIAACGDEPAAPDPGPSYDVVGGEQVDQVFLVTNTSDAGPGSLRQAILDANASIGRDGISFEIPGPGPHGIQPTSPLPPIFDAVVIDGYTQPGATANTNATALGTNAAVRVELDGSFVGGGGLVILADGTTVRGLAVNRFQDAIVLLGGGARVEGNFIGTDVTGTGAAANIGNGVLVLSADNLVGGDTPGARNVISGNLGDGVRIEGPSAQHNRVAGNYLGLDATGTTAIPNNIPEPDPTNGAAVHIISGASDNLVGGPSGMPSTCDGPCNVMSGNHRSGVWLENQANGNVVQGNLVGLDASGQTPMGNYRFGVFIGGVTTPVFDNVVESNRIEWNGRDGVGFYAGSSRNRVGGMGVTPGMCDGPCNLIANNGQRLDTGGDGVRVFANAGTRNAILGNSIFGQPHGQGIDIGNPGLTFNDWGDFDTGSNELMNYPQLISARAKPGHLVVSGWIDTQNPESALIEIYANPVPDPGGDPSGFGEGAIFLGRAAPAADGTFTVQLGGVDAGTLISATATDAVGNTSEFAANIEALPSRGPESELNPEFLPFSFYVGACTEVVSVTGSFRQDFTFTQIGPDRYHVSGHLNAVGAGLGQSTGAVYNFNDMIVQDQNFTFTSPQMTYTYEETVVLVGRGAVPDVRFTGRYHVTLTPDGVVAAWFENYDYGCS